MTDIIARVRELLGKAESHLPGSGFAANTLAGLAPTMVAELLRLDAENERLKEIIANSPAGGDL